MRVKVKKLHPDAVIPKYAKAGDAGLDLTAVTKFSDGINLSFGTGLAFEIPEGFVGLIFPRSSIYKTDNRLSNCVGVIDSGYRGEVSFKFDLSTMGLLKTGEQKEVIDYKVGDRIGQLIIMPYPQIELVEAEELSDTDRGTGGFGSTGK